MYALLNSTSNLIWLAENIQDSEINKKVKHYDQGEYKLDKEI